jgi:hypothetical protein
VCFLLICRFFPLPQPQVRGEWALEVLLLVDLLLVDQMVLLVDLLLVGRMVLPVDLLLVGRMVLPVGLLLADPFRVGLLLRICTLLVQAFFRFVVLATRMVRVLFGLFRLCWVDLVGRVLLP